MAVESIIELKAKIAKLEAEVKRLSTPSLFWDVSDVEYGYPDTTDILENYEPFQVVQVSCAASLPDLFIVDLPQTADGDSITGEFGTRAEAEAAVAAARAALAAA